MARPPRIPDLKQRKVLQLYRQLLKSVGKVPDMNSRIELREWVRGDFRKNKEIDDEFAIKSLIIHGEQALKELKVNLGLAQ